MSAATGVATAALLFDFGGTLDSDGVAWRQRFLRVWREEVGFVPAEQFDDAFYAADDSLVGAVDTESTLTGIAQRLARSLALRLGEGQGEPAERVAARFSGEALATLSSRRALLSRLGSRYRLGVVSNFYGNLAAACAEAGIEGHFSALIDSTDVGCTKPDAKIFRAALEKLQVRPEETVFVGDSIARDMAGARALGMPHVLLRAAPSRSEGAAESDDPFLCCPEDRVIVRLEDLEGALA
jgi:HAD superfamily hydrolase (TIGR01509 family)